MNSRQSIRILLATPVDMMVSSMSLITIWRASGGARNSSPRVVSRTGRTSSSVISCHSPAGIGPLGKLRSTRK